MTALDVLERCRATQRELYRSHRQLHQGHGGAAMVSWYGERVGSRGTPVYGTAQQWIDAFNAAMEHGRRVVSDVEEAKAVLGMLPGRERMVLRCFYVDMMDMDQIARYTYRSLSDAEKIKRDGDLLAGRIVVGARSAFLNDWRKSEHADR